MNKKTWDAMRAYRELNRWILANNERVIEEGRRKLAIVAAGSDNAHLGATDFRLQSVMYSAKGLVGLMDSDITALDHMYQAVYASRCELQFSRAYFYYYLPDVTPTCSINDMSLDLARAVVLGCLSDAESMAILMWQGLLDGLFYDLRETSVAPYILRLYALWMGIAAPKSRVPPKKEPIYDRLLEIWDIDDESAIERALMAACELHIERSRQTTDRETYEFNWTEHNLQPVEIMMVLRLRELKGLDVPILDHPVMNTPVAKLYPIRTVEPDPLLQAALAVELARVEEMEKQKATT